MLCLMEVVLSPWILTQSCMKTQRFGSKYSVATIKGGQEVSLYRICIFAYFSDFYWLCCCVIVNNAAFHSPSTSVQLRIG